MSDHDLRGMYLAYPIDQAGDSDQMREMFAQIEVFKQEAMRRGLVMWLFDPGDAFRVQVEADHGGVATINRAALNNADAVVAFLPAGVPSIGVPMEIDRARAMGKRVLVFTDAQSWMLRMQGVALIKGWSMDDLDVGLEWLGQQTRPSDGTDRKYLDLSFKVEPGSVMPHQQYDDDAGLDLYTSEDTVVPAHGFADVPCGVSADLPAGYWAMVTGRSSALRTRRLLVHTGIIDGGYRGPLFAGAFNLSNQDVRVAKGDRIAQLILFHNSTSRTSIVQSDVLTRSERGERGFGSSGR